MKSTKQKLDEVLGIKDDQSIDDFLDDISLNAEQLSSTFESVSEQVKSDLTNVDTKLAEINSGNQTDIQLAMNDLASSMKEVEDLVVLSKQMYKHIYENFCSSDLLDSELIGAAAKLLESIHINVKEFIDMYRERQRNIERLQQQQAKFEHDVFMENLKHKHAMERIQAKGDDGAIDVESGMVNFSQDEIIKALAKEDKARYLTKKQD